MQPILFPSLDIVIRVQYSSNKNFIGQDMRLQDFLNWSTEMSKSPVRASLYQVSPCVLKYQTEQGAFIEGFDWDDKNQGQIYE